MTESRVQHLHQLAKYISEASSGLDLKLLIKDVNDTLAVPEPLGTPGALTLYGRAVGLSDDLPAHRAAGRAYLDDEIPQMWLGMTSVSAVEAMTALDDELGRIIDMGDDCLSALRDYADSIERAQELDASGRRTVGVAQHELRTIGFPQDFNWDTMRYARDLALEGIEQMTTAAFQVEEAARKLVRQLNELAAEAHLSRLRTSSLTGVDKLALTTAAVPADADDTGDVHDSNLILTADATGRASDRLDAMTPEERIRFDSILARATSPQERAYLVQALAAGHSIEEIRTFSGKIHGRDPKWLRNHLTPAYTPSGEDLANTQFDGRAWNQSEGPTCVPAATVLAHARIDPIYAFDLTTGGHPDDPRFDNGDAFQQRLHNEQLRIDDEGRSFVDDAVGSAGVDDDGKEHLADLELSGPTGRDYELHDLDTPMHRRGVLTEVEQSVDQGIPVLVTVEDQHGSHEMLIIDHEGDRLKVYNPWGYTTWINESDFVDGHMGASAPGVPSTVDDVTVGKR